jgi:hypothetical protein
MNQRQIDENNARVLRDAGYVTKAIEGDQSSARDYDPADNRQPMSAESIRVGDARVLNPRGSFMPNMARTYADTS